MAAISIPTTAIPRVPSFSDGGFGVVCVPLVLGLKCGLLLNRAAQDDPRARVQQIAFGLGGSCSPNFETRHYFVSVSYYKSNFHDRRVTQFITGGEYNFWELTDKLFLAGCRHNLS